MNIFKHTDSLSLMATLEKGSVDLVPTDPPYIISHETGFKNVKGVQRFAVETEYGEWDTKRTSPSLISKTPSRNIIVFCDLVALV